jgi:hypothetical protein
MVLALPEEALKTFKRDFLKGDEGESSLLHSAWVGLGLHKFDMNPLYQRGDGTYYRYARALAHIHLHDLEKVLTELIQEKTNKEEEC